MKLNYDFNLTEVLDQTVATPVNEELQDCGLMITLNDVGRDIFERIQQGKNRDEIIKELLDEYDATYEQIESDTDKLISALSEKKLITFENAEDMLDNVGWYLTTVRGSSMFPMIRSGVDKILVKKPMGRLNPYDVAVYRTPPKYTVHRVIEVHPDHYIIRGDNCVSNEYVFDSRIVGVVTGFWKGDRFIEVTDPKYLRYAHFWVAINPLVRLWHLPRRVAAKIFHSIFGRDVPSLHMDKRN